MNTKKLKEKIKELENWNLWKISGTKAYMKKKRKKRFKK